MSQFGRPKITDEEYQRWLDAMSPFLLHGYSLNHAIEKSGLIGHRTSVYEKYAQKDWFSDKIDTLQRTIGELANNIAYKVIANAHAKLVQSKDYKLTKEEVRVLILVATKHRASHGFFVSRIETARARDLGKIVEVPEIKYFVPNES